MDTISIRSATLSDAETLMQFNCNMAMETEGKTLDKAIVLPAVKAVFDDPSNGFYLLAEVDEVAAGSLMVTYEWSDWRNYNIWWIQSVYVGINYRRKGIYKALYNEVKNRAIAAGVKTIRLYVEKENTNAQLTYEALGMQQSPYLMYEEVIV